MMVLEYRKVNMTMYLSHFIKLIKVEQTQNLVLVGFSIASDIIRSHGGNINLEKSK